MGNSQFWVVISNPQYAKPMPGSGWKNRYDTGKTMLQ
jgi:hypothetical protein